VASATSLASRISGFGVLAVADVAQVGGDHPAPAPLAAEGDLDGELAAVPMAGDGFEAPVEGVLGRGRSRSRTAWSWVSRRRSGKIRSAMGWCRAGRRCRSCVRRRG
jgi:hypothetical protein